MVVLKINFWAEKWHFLCLQIKNGFSFNRKNWQFILLQPKNKLVCKTFITKKSEPQFWIDIATFFIEMVKVRIQEQCIYNVSLDWPYLKDLTEWCNWPCRKDIFKEFQKARQTTYRWYFFKNKSEPATTYCIYTTTNYHLLQTSTDYYLLLSTPPRKMCQISKHKNKPEQNTDTYTHKFQKGKANNKHIGGTTHTWPGTASACSAIEDATRSSVAFRHSRISFSTWCFICALTCSCFITDAHNGYKMRKSGIFFVCNKANEIYLLQL